LSLKGRNSLMVGAAPRTDGRQLEAIDANSNFDAAQRAGVGAASLETCSPRLRHMEEIEATQVALDSRLASAPKLRCPSFSCLAKIAQLWKESEGTPDNNSASRSTEPS
jgi:hypothetical protein